MKLRADAAEAVSQTQVAVQQVADNHVEHQRAIELLGQAAKEQHTQLDATLRGHVVEEVTRLNLRIDSLTASASVAGTTSAIDARLQQLSTDINRLEEHVNVRSAELGGVIQA